MHWRKLSAAKKHTYKANSRAAHASMSKDEHDAWKAARRVKDRARRAETCFLEEDAERDARRAANATRECNRERCLVTTPGCETQSARIFF